MSRYLALFVGEASEHLDALAKDLVRLESERTPALIDSLFRHAHSVKGMAASMGFAGTATVAHRAEDLLATLREKPDTIDRVSVDLLLAATDLLQSHVKSAESAQAFADPAALLASLSEKLVSLTGQAPAETRVAEAVVSRPSAPPPPVRSAGAQPRYQVKVRVSPQCATPGVRGFLVYKRLTLLGNVFDLRPALEDIKAGKMIQGLISLELETAESEAQVIATLKTIADVTPESVTPISAAAKAPPPPEPPAPEGPKPVGAEPPRTVRVKTELLDQFLDQAGELLLATARVREVGKGLPRQYRPSLEEAVDRLHVLVKELHDKVMKARMTPIGVILDRLPRASRDIARRRERDIELVLTGAEIELDRSIVDELADPLLHLLRNAIDHGIELPQARLDAGKPAKGRVGVSVSRRRDRVVVEVSDDGKGMDPAKLKALAVERGLITQESADGLTDKEAFLLCCLPGISTAADVSDISGRGVGMDAVKRAVEHVGGTLEIDSTRGVGSTIRLQLPLTVAVVNLLLVGVGREVLGVPIGKVSGVTEEKRDVLSPSQAGPLLSWGAQLVPVHQLAALLQLEGQPPPSGTNRPFVVVEGENGRLALEVDRLLGQEEVVLKPLLRPLDHVEGLAGVTILGNGRPVFILDVARLSP